MFAHLRQDDEASFAVFNEAMLVKITDAVRCKNRGRCERVNLANEHCHTKYGSLFISFHAT